MVALSVSVIEFNLIIAAGIFVGVAALSAICFATAKACEKINEEKGKNSSISSYVTLENELITECVKSSEATIS